MTAIYLTSNPQRVSEGTPLGTVVPLSLVYRADPQQLTETNSKTDVDEDRVDFGCEVYETMGLSTHSQITSSSEFEF